MKQKIWKTVTPKNEGMLQLFMLSYCTHYFIVHLLALQCKCIIINIQLRHQLNECIDTAFSLEKFIDHNYFFSLENTITTLKGASFVTDDIAIFLCNSFNFI